MTGGLPPSPVVERIEVRRVALALVDARVAAHGVETVRDSIIVSVTDADGGTGWGECVALARPTYTGEWTAGAWTVITELLGPALLAGVDAGVVGHPMAGAALADAALDLALRREGRSLSAALGSASRVRSCAVVGLDDDPGRTAAVVEARLAHGYRAVKLKVGGGSIAAVQRVRHRWPDLDLAVDANGSFDLGRDDGRLADLAALDLTYVEQPLAATDLAGHAALRRRGIRIALDESIASVGALDAAMALGALDLVNVKPGRVGGVRATVELLSVMEEREVGGFCGGMYELGIARAAALAIAGSPGLRARPCDLGPSEAYVKPDITTSVVLDPDGTLAVPSGPGIGPIPDLDRLDEVTVAAVELRR